jgi:hypothetical protein
MTGDEAYGDAKGVTVRRSLLEYPGAPAPHGSSESGEFRVFLSVLVPCSNVQEVLRETNRRLVFSSLCCWSSRLFTSMTEAQTPRLI